MPGVKLWLWDKAGGEWRPAQCNAEGKLEIASVEDAEISQTTPEDLRHVPHGYYAAGPSYLPYAVNVDGKLLLQTAALDHLNDIGDVDVAAPVDGQLIRWDAGNSKWQKVAALTIADNGVIQALLTQTLFYTYATIGSTLEIYSYDGAAYHKVTYATAGYWFLKRAKLAADLVAQGNRVTGLANPAAAQDADTKAARDAAIATHTAIKTAHHSNVASITFIIDGGGAVITTGEKGHLEIPFACTITQATLLADQSGSIVIDIWKDTYANFPPTDADSITSAAPPTITAAQKSQDSTLTDWTTAIAAGDILAFNVDSIATIKRVTLSLRVTKT